MTSAIFIAVGYIAAVVICGPWGVAACAVHLAIVFAPTFRRPRPRLDHRK